MNEPEALFFRIRNHDERLPPVITRYHVLFFVLAIALALVIGLALGFLFGPWAASAATLIGAALGGGSVLAAEEYVWRQRK